MSQGIRSQLVRDAEYFYSKGWMFGTAGNLSARKSGEKEFWITASGCNKGELGLTDFVKINLRNEVADKFRSDAKPSAETSIHLSVYNAFPDVSACYHVHSPESNIVSKMAVNGELLLPDIEMLKGFGFFGKAAKIMVFPNHDKVPQIAEDMISGFKSSSPQIPAALIEGHGVTVWADSQSRAKNYVELMEYIFRYMVLAR